jgi:hypothetical protein
MIIAPALTRVAEQFLQMLPGQYGATPRALLTMARINAYSAMSDGT